MSRETKYRAWDEDCEVMYYSDKEYDNCHFGFHEGRVVAWLRQTEPQTLDAPAHDYGKPVDVEQYIGKKDQNEQEIYEGDIAIATEDESLPPMTGIVEYEPNHAEWWFHNPILEQSLYFSDMNSSVYWTEQIEVIGNIHTTPQLLEAH